MRYSLIIHNFVWQGTAAFWYNLLKSGESDASTLHAACPVIVGTKWGEYTVINDGLRFSPQKRIFCVIRRTREREKLHHFHIDHNAPYLPRLPLTSSPPPSPHQKKCITTIFDSSWDDLIPRRQKGKKPFVQNFGEGRGAGVNKSRYGLCKNSE